MCIRDRFYLAQFADKDKNGQIDYYELESVLLAVTSGKQTASYNPGNVLEERVVQTGIEVDASLPATGTTVTSARGAQVTVDPIVQLFFNADTNRDGFLEKPEFTSCLLKLGLAVGPSEQENLFRMADSNQTGKIDLGEFRQFYAQIRGQQNNKSYILQCMRAHFSFPHRRDELSR
eukprot:TRINITY_DN511_c0_g1_i18.p3 TRINITY_DN511_c0_g1~~TRINITY_DN511_c0_g1_i18.p3  ORF type:complete len:176 (-),score=76.30 TRINITY_DN511_c0_g1_i18:103-630(-)